MYNNRINDEHYFIFLEYKTVYSVSIHSFACGGNDAIFKRKGDKGMLSKITQLVEFFAVWGAGVASLFGSYEPQVPDSLIED